MTTISFVVRIQSMGTRVEIPIVPYRIWVESVLALLLTIPAGAIVTNIILRIQGLDAKVKQTSFGIR